MKIHFRGAVCAILLTVPIFGTAQEKATLNLSLEQAKEYAVEHNRTLMNASLDIRKAEAGRWQAIASLLPQVKGSVDYSNYCGYKMEIWGKAFCVLLGIYGLRLGIYLIVRELRSASYRRILRPETKRMKY